MNVHIPLLSLFQKCLTTSHKYRCAVTSNYSYHRALFTKHYFSELKLLQYFRQDKNLGLRVKFQDLSQVGLVASGKAAIDDLVSSAALLKHVPSTPTDGNTAAS